MDIQDSQPLAKRTPLRNNRQPIVVVGLGYVGLPVALAFDRAGFRTTGFDVNGARIRELLNRIDSTRHVYKAELATSAVEFTDDPSDLPRNAFFVVCVPTPVDEGNNPDLTALRAASTTVGRAMGPGATVVYESTVYPGATEEECKPILEHESGLIAGRDFRLGYSPERINPGDPEHRFETIRKVVSGYTPECLDIIADTYGAVVKAGTYSASSIRVAEAAKVIENSQRDLNIAFVNELALIFSRLEIDTLDVLEAASTKWNFLPFKPGLVGGHCISVDPFYLAHKAARIGYHSEVILSGRRMNDGMGRHVARECVKRLIKTDMGDKRVAILGMTFKEDVADVRNSKVADIVRELVAFGIDVTVVDPLADPSACRHEIGIALTPLERVEPVTAIILAVPHSNYRKTGWSLMTQLLRGGRGLVLDVKGVLDRATRPDGIELWRL